MQVHDKHDNMMQPRTTGALALRPTGSTQGNYNFLSLTTGQQLNHVDATLLPMLDDVTEWIHALAQQQKGNQRQS